MGPDRHNHAIRTVVSVLGITFAMGGFVHGWFEYLQGDVATGGMYINSIAPPHVQWSQGTDPAMTLIPVFRWTGIASMSVSVAIVLWSLFLVGTRHGPLIYLCLFIALTLVGGGIGHIPFFLSAWAYATRIDKPLVTWARIWPAGRREAAGRLWPILMALSSFGFIIGLVTSVFGIPGIADDATILAICWTALGIGFVLEHAAFATAAASDLQARHTA